jgi:hypothetical protein
MACRLGRLLDPYPTALLFVHFPLLDAHAPTQLALTHCQLVVRGSGGKMTIFSNGAYDKCKYPDPLIYTPI